MDAYDVLSQDYLNDHQLDTNESRHISNFKGVTNLPERLRAAIGARKMFLNNTLFFMKIANGSLGVIVSTNEESINVAFPHLTP